MNSTKLKIISSFVAIFVFGAVCGVALTRVVRLPKLEHRKFSEKTLLVERLEKDAERLKLNPAQVQSLGKQFQELEKELRGIREETNQRIDQAIDRHMNSVTPELTSEQRTLYEEIRRKTKEKR